MVRELTQIPEDLTRGRLKRLGEGIGKVVYASEHWVVKRERTPTEVAALIILWKVLRRWFHMLPFHWGDRLLSKPSKILRFMRVATQAGMAVIPRSVWYTSHIAQVWRTYHYRDRRGARLARSHLTGTDVLPQTVAFPPAAVSVGGWPGWLIVEQATERVEDTLDRRIAALAGAGSFNEVEVWLNRFVDLRQTGWQLGVFSVDAHLRNFGVIGERIVLLDTGGLTNRWTDISAKLASDEAVEEPHVQLGLERVLAEEPEVARRFNERWKATVNQASVREHWPDEG